MRYLNKLFLTLGVSSILLLPNISSANEILDLKILENEHELEIAIFATESLSKPRIRTSRGLIRAWFPNIRKNARLTIQGDGEHIKWVKLRPGTKGSGLVKIRLGDERRLDDSEIQLIQIGSHGRIQIPKNLLPQIVSNQKTKVEEAKEAIVHPSMQKTKGENKSVKSERHAGLFGSTQKSNTKETNKEKAIAQASLAESSSNKSSTEKVTIGNQESLLNWGVYLLALSLLALIYVAIRIIQKGKMPPAKNQWIQIIATKRIGPRQQFLVVRALGEDHLLSMSGGKTEKIASMPSQDFVEEQTLLDVSSRNQIPGLRPGLLGRLKTGLGFSNARKETKLEDSIFDEAPQTGSKFGEDLLKATASNSYAKQSASKQKDNHQPFDTFVPGTSFGQSIPPSEAIAGILKLRDQATLQ